MNRRHHPVWNDAQGPINEGVGAGGLTNVVLRGSLARIQAFSSTGKDSVTFYCQMPHNWDGRSKVRPHIHYVPLAAPASNKVVLWEWRYAWSLLDEEIPTDASWTTGTAQTTILTTDAFKQKIQAMGDIAPPAGAGPSAFLMVYLSRNGASATDTYTDGGVSNLGVLGMDTHYQYSRHGSLDELGESMAR